MDGAAPGWPGLPLRALDFDSNSGEFRLGAPALDALGRLGSCLTQLALSGGVLVETTPTGEGNSVLSTGRPCARQFAVMCCTLRGSHRQCLGLPLPATAGTLHIVQATHTSLECCFV